MIYLECYADEAFIKAFGVSSKSIKHAFSKGDVCNLLRKSENSVGIVDEDPLSGKPHYEKQMLTNVVFQSSRLTICADNRTRNSLVIIRPRIEEFFLGLVKDHGIKIEPKLSLNISALREELGFKRRTQKFEFFTNIFSQIIDKDKSLREVKTILKNAGY